MAQLVRRWSLPKGRLSVVELYVTPDIVALPPVSTGSSHCTGTSWRRSFRKTFALVNSANERLEGTRFNTSEAARTFQNTNRVYPEQTVDGRVYELGGTALQEDLSAMPADANGSRCPIGKAVLVNLDVEKSPLSQSFHHIVCTVAPVYMSPGWQPALGRCYRSALDRIWAQATKDKSLSEENCATELCVALPLLGAGAKGIPCDIAATIAAGSCSSWQASQHNYMALDANSRSLKLQFCVQEDEVAGALEIAFDTYFSKNGGRSKV